MTREEWEAEAKARAEWDADAEGHDGLSFVEFRRRERRVKTQHTAKSAYDAAMMMLGAQLGTPRTGAVEGVSYNGSAVHSDTAALVAIVKFGRRFNNLFHGAYLELNKRYNGTAHGREVQRIIKAINNGTRINEDTDLEEPLPVKVKQRLCAERRKELKRQYKMSMR